MPIVRNEDLGTERAPAWCRVQGGIVGIGHSAKEAGATVEYHFHDYEEFWFVLKGAARVVSEGQEYVARRGDVVCTALGEEHALTDILEAPYEHVWLACNRRGRGRVGHLHRGVDEAA
ncbi:MAG: cupin domain-containing protein [Chloroflexota bacterium]